MFNYESRFLNPNFLHYWERWNFQGSFVTQNLNLIIKNLNESNLDYEFHLFLSLLQGLIYPYLNKNVFKRTI